MPSKTVDSVISSTPDETCEISSSNDSGNEDFIVTNTILISPKTKKYKKNHLYTKKHKPATQMHEHTLFSTMQVDSLVKRQIRKSDNAQITETIKSKVDNGKDEDFDACSDFSRTDCEMLEDDTKSNLLDTDTLEWQFQQNLSDLSCNSSDIESYSSMDELHDRLQTSKTEFCDSNSKTKHRIVDESDSLNNPMEMVTRQIDTFKPSTNATKLREATFKKSVDFRQPSTASEELEELRNTLRILANNDVSTSIKERNMINSCDSSNVYRHRSTHPLNMLSNKESQAKTHRSDNNQAVKFSKSIKRSVQERSNKTICEDGSEQLRRENRNTTKSDSLYTSMCPSIEFESQSPRKAPTAYYPSRSVTSQNFQGNFACGNSAGDNPILQIDHSISGNIGLKSGGGIGAHGSRAVVSALKALQDKIHRLEEDRDKLVKENADINAKAMRRESEFVIMEKKLTYEMSQRRDKDRALYDKLRVERDELKVDLAKYEERQKAQISAEQQTQSLIKSHEASSNDLRQQLQAVEREKSTLLQDLTAVRSNQEQLVLDLREEIDTLRVDKESTIKQMAIIQTQLEQEKNSAMNMRSRLQDCEKTIANMVQLNERLSNKLWELSEVANKSVAKAIKSTPLKKNAPTLLKPTAAGRACRAKSSNLVSASKQDKKIALVKMNERIVASKCKLKKRQKPSMNNMELLQNANAGNSSSPGFSLLGHVQESMNQCNTMYGSIVRPHTSIRNTKAPVSTSSSILGLCADNSPEDIDKRMQQRHRPNSVNTDTISNPYQSSMLSNLDEAIKIVEDEISSLNRKYRDTLAQLESKRSKVCSSRHNEEMQINKDEGYGAFGYQYSSELTQELTPTLDALESKNRQLLLLKQVREQTRSSFINSSRTIVHSPEAVKRKVASLRVLNEYRTMEREAR